MEEGKTANGRIITIATHVQVFDEQRALHMANLGLKQDSTSSGFSAQAGTNLVWSTQKKVQIVGVGSLSEETSIQGDNLLESTLIERGVAALGLRQRRERKEQSPMIRTLVDDFSRSIVPHPSESKLM